MRKVVISILLAILIMFTYLSLRENFRMVGNIIDSKDEARESIAFNGFDGKEIFGSLIYPKGENKKDMVIVLPGGGGTKESREYYSDIFLEEGFGALILDQRGIGETDGEVSSFNDDFYTYINGDTPDQMLMARDVSSAVDYLESREDVDDIAVLGESMGGRYAVIAASFDMRIKGVILVSSAGFWGNTGNEFTQKYLDYINPNNYIKGIEGRRVLMLHSLNDGVIPIEEARLTFNLAGEPKQFIEFDEEECKHGYCEPMKNVILEELRKIFG